MPAPIKLYSMEGSPSCCSVMMVMKVLNVPYEMQNLDFMNWEHKKEWFLKINSLGETPTIDDNGFILDES